MSKKITVSKAIGEALHEEMLRDDKMFIMGEDMAVMGNVFAITRGFLDEFGPNRVIDTPISEEGFVGMAVGAAMRGMHPVVELMYDDFATECADPLFNQAAKIRYMTGGQCSVPMVLRAPMGAGRRNAGQHSQSLENFFCHFPGLKVVAPCSAEDAKGLLKKQKLLLEKLDKLAKQNQELATELGIVNKAINAFDETVYTDNIASALAELDQETSAWLKEREISFDQVAEFDLDVYEDRRHLLENDRGQYQEAIAETKNDIRIEKAQ